jgi:hypothetical protein
LVENKESRPNQCHSSVHIYGCRFFLIFYREGSSLLADSFTDELFHSSRNKTCILLISSQTHVRTPGWDVLDYSFIKMIILFMNSIFIKILMGYLNAGFKISRDEKLEKKTMMIVVAAQRKLCMGNVRIKDAVLHCILTQLAYSLH